MSSIEQLRTLAIIFESSILDDNYCNNIFRYHCGYCNSRISTIIYCHKCKTLLTVSAEHNLEKWKGNIKEDSCRSFHAKILLTDINFWIERMNSGVLLLTINVPHNINLYNSLVEAIKYYFSINNPNLPIDLIL